MPLPFAGERDSRKFGKTALLVRRQVRGLPIPLLQFIDCGHLDKPEPRVNSIPRCMINYSAMDICKDDWCLCV